MSFGAPGTAEWTAAVLEETTDAQIREGHGRAAWQPRPGEGFFSTMASSVRPGPAAAPGLSQYLRVDFALWSGPGGNDLLALTVRNT